MLASDSEQIVGHLEIRSGLPVIRQQSAICDFVTLDGRANFLALAHGRSRFIRDRVFAWESRDSNSALDHTARARFGWEAFEKFGAPFGLKSGYPGCSNNGAIRYGEQLIEDEIVFEISDFGIFRRNPPEVSRKKPDIRPERSEPQRLALADFRAKQGTRLQEGSDGFDSSRRLDSAAQVKQVTKSRDLRPAGGNMFCESKRAAITNLIRELRLSSTANNIDKDVGRVLVARQRWKIG